MLPQKAKMDDVMPKKTQDPMRKAPTGTCVHVCVCVRVHSVVSDSNCMDCSCQVPVYGIFQTRIVEWVTISYSRGSSKPRD